MSKHTHLFSKNHSSAEIEWLKKPFKISDNYRTKIARHNYGRQRSVLNAYKLCDALKYQLKYTEAYQILIDFFDDYKNDYTYLKRLAVLEFKILKFDDAINHLNLLLTFNNSEPYLHYILGTLYYFTADYHNALKHFYALSNFICDDGELYIGVIYWVVLANLKLGCKDFATCEDFILLTKNYNGKFGHHTGYQMFYNVFNGDIDAETAISKIDKSGVLQTVCLYYGLSVLYRNNQLGKKYLKLCLDNKDWFGAYSYIAAFVDNGYTLSI